MYQTGRITSSRLSTAERVSVNNFNSKPRLTSTEKKKKKKKKRKKNRVNPVELQQQEAAAAESGSLPPLKAPTSLPALTAVNHAFLLDEGNPFPRKCSSQGEMAFFSDK